MANKKNEVVLTFGGDATALEKASQRATQATDKTDGKFEKLASGAAFLTAGLSNLTDSIETVADVSRMGQQRAQALARAQADAAQATLDLSQAQRDQAQSGLDAEQAALDLEQAQRDYNDAVAEYGENSLEARQALLDQKQAQEDLAQAQQDGQQATQDATQAQLDLKDAQQEASDISGWRGWLDTVGGFAPLLMTVVGAMQLMQGASIAQTIAQWAQNAAWLAFPITWIIAGIVALIAIIVVMITHWDDVKRIAGKAWDWIKEKAVDFWDWLKGLPEKIKNAFLGLGDILLSPYKWAFNKISDAWNNTVGKLQWTVPSWVPGIGGNTVGAPKLPHWYHGGGIVQGTPGEDVLAVLQAGERVIPRQEVSREEQASGDTYNINVTIDPTKVKTLDELIALLKDLRNNRRRKLGMA